ncbi:MAG: hypothetical protein JWN78_1230 [Bacteroidota bacterium]|nr:hypothetical protein [Bacteroidota bacterium]
MLSFITKYKIHLLPILLFISILLYIRFLLVFSYSVDLAGLEYYFINIVQRMNTHQPLYPDLQAYPFYNCLYTPIYFYLLSAIAYVTRLDVYNDIHKILVVGRIFSLLIVFIQFIYLAKLTRKLTASYTALVIVFAVFISLLTGHVYAVRPDSLKLLLFTMFIYYLLEYLFYNPKRLNGILCIFCAVCAVYSKQDIFIYIVLCLAIVFLFLRNRKSLLLFCSFIAACMVCYAVMLLVYGKYIFPNLFLLNVQKITNVLKSYNISFVSFSIVRTGPLLLLAFFNLKRLWHTDNNFSPSKFIAVTSIFFYPLAHSSLMRAGANLNYTYELSFILVLNIPIFFSVYAANIERHKILSASIVPIYLILLLIGNVFIKNYYFDKEEEKLYAAEYAYCLKEKNDIMKITGHDPIFFPNSKYSIFYGHENIVNGHDMHLDRFINLYTPVYIQSRLLFLSTDIYDAAFTNGMIKYIVVQDNEKFKLHVQQYYPYYAIYKGVGHSLIYKFNNNKPVNQ